MTIVSKLLIQSCGKKDVTRNVQISYYLYNVVFQRNIISMLLN